MPKPAQRRRPPCLSLYIRSGPRASLKATITQHAGHFAFWLTPLSWAFPVMLNITCTVPWQDSQEEVNFPKTNMTMEKRLICRCISHIVVMLDMLVFRGVSLAELFIENLQLRMSTKGRPVGRATQHSDWPARSKDDVYNDDLPWNTFWPKQEVSIWMMIWLHTQDILAAYCLGARILWSPVSNQNNTSK